MVAPMIPFVTLVIKLRLDLLLSLPMVLVLALFIGWFLKRISLMRAISLGQPGYPLCRLNVGINKEIDEMSGIFCLEKLSAKSAKPARKRRVKRLRIFASSPRTFHFLRFNFPLWSFLKGILVSFTLPASLRLRRDVRRCFSFAEFP